MISIHPKFIKPTGKVDLWDLGPTEPDDDASLEHAAWKKAKAVFDGPVKVELWSVDARHALTVDPKRYKIELPKGSKPGPAEERRLEQLAAENPVEGTDPHYGAQA
ncbi:MAG: hypothetical protein ABIO35_08255 [Nitrobacter sp.]